MFGEILAGAGALSSILGGSKGKMQALPQSGYGALPEKVQDIWMDSFIPGVQDVFDAGPRMVPLQRAANPATDPFASRAAHNFQQYSDSVGGFFPRPAMRQQAPAPATGGIDASMMGELIAALGGLPGSGMSNLGMARAMSPQLARMNIAKGAGRKPGKNYDMLTSFYRALGGK